MKLAELAALVGAMPKAPWRYDPKHEMFLGTTNAIEMYDRVLDLGRDGKEYTPYQDETGKGYRITENSRKQYERTVALGKFLEWAGNHAAQLLAVCEAAEALPHPASCSLTAYGYPCDCELQELRAALRDLEGA